MAGKVRQFPGTVRQPAEPLEPEVDVDALLAKLKDHFDDLVKDIMEDPGAHTSVLTILSTDTQTTTSIRGLGDGLDLPGLSLGLLRAQRILGEQGD